MYVNVNACIVGPMFHPRGPPGPMGMRGPRPGLGSGGPGPGGPG